MARHKSSKAEIRAWVERTCGYDLSRTCDQIRPGYRFNESCQQTVPEALIAFLESTDFEDAIRNVISLGGDSDTLACITGSVAEAFYGGVPAGIEREALARLDDPLREVLGRFRGRFGIAQ
jgi:ADP-ribosylglycohydrolase